MQPEWNLEPIKQNQMPSNGKNTPMKVKIHLLSEQKLIPKHTCSLIQQSTLRKWDFMKSGHLNKQGDSSLLFKLYTWVIP